jgi:Protein of unknown function (DUF2892)
LDEFDYELQGGTVMKSNLGKTDRILRMIAGATIIAVGVVNQTWLGAIGLVPILTSAIGWCPGYQLFGFSTCQSNQSTS